MAEIDQANPGLLDKVFFFSGVARNSEHLILCGVERARVVAIIRPPRAAEASEEGSDISKSAMVNADRHTIITSLNLHIILLEQQLRQQEEEEQSMHLSHGRKNCVNKGAFTGKMFIFHLNTVMFNIKSR